MEQVQYFSLNTEEFKLLFDHADVFCPPWVCIPNMCLPYDDRRPTSSNVVNDIPLTNIANQRNLPILSYPGQSETWHSYCCLQFIDFLHINQFFLGFSNKMIWYSTD